MTNTADIQEHSRSRPGVVAITGANGLVGSAVARRFIERGWTVRALTRERPGELAGSKELAGRVEWFRCELPDAIDEAAFAGCDAVVHAAYSMKPGPLQAVRRVNEEGTRKVLELARRAGARFVFISTMSSHEGALSYYGRSKFALEQTVDRGRELVIRPGLVLSPRGGVFGAMAEQIRKMRVIPLVSGGRQPLQTIHIDDLSEGIVTAVERGATGLMTIAEREAISMREFIGVIAGRLGRKPVLAPVPARLVLAGAVVMEKAGLKAPISAESVRGLMAMRAADVAADLAKIGLNPRSARESLRDLAL